MQIKNLGSGGLTASEIGLGCMGMSDFYGSRNDIASIQTLHRALELGVNFWDTSDMYGPYHNEELIGKALKGKRGQVTLATKFGIMRDPVDPMKRAFNGKPDYVKSACEASLKRLDIETIDLYYLHRVDPATPIEETVGAMAELIKEGKVKAIGLSEASAATLKRAHQVHPVSALQTEYSLWSREPEDELLQVCKTMGIAFVAYSPLGRGFLTGEIKKFEDFEPGDYRRISPRFQGDNFKNNLVLVDKIRAIAERKNCTPSQLALAWVLAQGEHIFPIPGTKRIQYLEENVNALTLEFTVGELEEINNVFPKNAASGMRYPENMMKTVNG